MRVSCDPHDYGYHPQCLNCKVYVNGVELSRVLTADTIECCAYITVRNADGHLRFDDYDRPITVSVYGNVIIEYPDDFDFNYDYDEDMKWLNTTKLK